MTTLLNRNGWGVPADTRNGWDKHPDATTPPYLTVGELMALLSTMHPNTWVATSADGPVQTVHYDGPGAAEPTVTLGRCPEGKMTEDEQGLVADYHDNALTTTLRGFIGNQTELDRLNTYRGTSWGMLEFNRVISAAIEMREKDEQT